MTAPEQRPRVYDPRTRDLRHQLWLGSGCFALMLAGLLIALYALSLDRGLQQAFERSLTQRDEVLQLQLALLELRHRQEHALRDGREADAEIGAIAARARALVDALVPTEVGAAARQRLHQAVDDSQRLYRELAADAPRAPVAATERWRARSGAVAAAADGALRALVDELNRAVAAEHARAWEVTRFARQLMIGLALLTALLGVLFGVLALRAAAAHQRLYGQLDALAHTDGLTGVMNRRGLDDRLPVEIARADRLGYAFTVVMLDLDYFKRFNDRRGHGAGDALLRGAAQSWRQQLRPTDILARYGGEEFTLVLPACDAEQARQLVDRLRPLTPEAQTFSAGIAQRHAGESEAELLLRADAALLAAKRGGRNRSVVSGEEPQMMLPLRVVR